MFPRSRGRVALERDERLSWFDGAWRYWEAMRVLSPTVRQHVEHNVDREFKIRKSTVAHVWCTDLTYGRRVDARIARCLIYFLIVSIKSSRRCL